MKKKKAIIFIGALSFFINALAAQNDSDTVLTTFWYLQSLVIDDVEITPPINDEVPNVPFFFDGGSDFEPPFLFTSVCNEIVSTSDVFSDVIIIIFKDTNPLIDCQLQENIDFGMIYINFLEATTEFPYQLIDEGNSLQLILTAPNGDQAIYGDEVLSVEDVKAASFQVHPNPVRALLELDMAQGLDHTGVTVYNTLGNEIMKSAPETSSIDMSALPQGMYFIVLTTDQGDLVKKILKQ